MKHAHPSLRRALTRSMIIMQAVVLVAFTLAAAVPILHMVTEDQVLDGGVIKDIAKSVVRNDDGSLGLSLDEDLEEVVAEYPDFWFYAADIDGNHIDLGDLPQQIDDIAPYLFRINSANIGNLDSPSAGGAILRNIESDAGRLWIITAGGPRIGLEAIGVAFSNPFFFGLLFLFTVSSILLIPVIVGRQLRGIEAVAAQADTIDVDQRGVRLSVSRVPQELHSLVNAVNEALARLDRGIERDKRFMADAAHELRTPIAILQTRLELLPDSEERRQLLLDTARLGSMADQLLDLQRMDLSPAPFVDVDLVEIASSVTADLAPLAIAAGDEISFHADADTVMVKGDAQALTRAMTNLVQNAIAHGGQGIDIAIAVLADRRVRVTDTGRGIDPTERAEIFEPFHRVTPLQHGAGLGLNLVRDIVQRHGGRVTVGSMEGGGASFEIALPPFEAPSSKGAAGQRKPQLSSA